MTVENGMIFRVVDIEAMGIVKEWGEPMWPYLQEALDRAITVGGIEEFEPNYDAFFEVLESWKYGDARWNGVKQDEMYRQAVQAAFPDG